MTTRSKKLSINIQFCGDWNYKRHHDSLVEALEKQFPNQLNMTYIQDEEVTYNFEITLAESGLLLHSNVDKTCGG